MQIKVKNGWEGKRFQWRLTVFGQITKEAYNKLRNGGAIEIDDANAKRMIATKYFVEVLPKTETISSPDVTKKKKGGE